MLKSLRRHIMMQSGGGLPSEYQQVEYILLTNSTWLLFNKLIYYDSWVEGDFLAEEGNSGWLFCTTTNGVITETRYLGLLYQTNDEGHSTRLYYDRSYRSSHALLGSWNTFRSGQYSYLNGVLMREASLGSFVEQQCKFFVIDAGKECQNTFFRVGRGDDLQIDCVGCRRKSDGIFGYYDFVSKQFFRSHSGTDFTGVV